MFILKIKIKIFKKQIFNGISRKVGIRNEVSYSYYPVLQNHNITDAIWFHNLKKKKTRRLRHQQNV